LYSFTVINRFTMQRRIRGENVTEKK